MSHPLNAKVVKTKHHQGVGITTQGGHGPKRLKNGKNGEFLVKKEEKNSRDGCWLEEGSSLKKEKLARDDHARVPLGIPTALFPLPRGFDPVRSLPETRFALYKGHFARNHLWESLGRSGDRRFRPDGRRSTRNPKTGLEVKN
jgi:hypothetical protein